MLNPSYNTYILLVALMVRLSRRAYDQVKEVLLYDEESERRGHKRL